VLLKSLARRYAQALYGLAENEKKVDERLQELIKTREVLAKHPSLNRSLLSPTIPAQVKRAILRRLLEKSVSPLVLHFFFVLVDKSREVYVAPIVEAYKQLIRESRGEIEVVVRSAEALPENLNTQVKEILAKRTGKKVELKVEVDPELLGGLQIIVGDSIIDGSLRTQLGKMQERFAKATAAAAGG
jgi:F-type H+-transporting ATPase subunit delta